MEGWGTYKCLSHMPREMSPLKSNVFDETVSIKQKSSIKYAVQSLCQHAKGAK